MLKLLIVSIAVIPTVAWSQGKTIPIQTAVEIYKDALGKVITNHKKFKLDRSDTLTIMQLDSVLVTRMPRQINKTHIRYSSWDQKGCLTLGKESMKVFLLSPLIFQEAACLFYLESYTISSSETIRSPQRCDFLYKYDHTSEMYLYQKVRCE